MSKCGKLQFVDWCVSSKWSINNEEISVGLVSASLSLDFFWMGVLYLESSIWIEGSKVVFPCYDVLYFEQYLL